MYKRRLEKQLKTLSTQYPAIALLGPRQSGKTTLTRSCFPSHTYVSLEELDKREFAKEDPRGFLKTYGQKAGLILDEIQHVPELLSYLQTIIDESETPGQFILTGSQHLLISEKITQTLAGRIALLSLLPLSIEELQETPHAKLSANEFIFRGGYPRIYARNIDAETWYPNYIQTYIEKDVRSLQHITNLSLFQKFLKLCAGRIGQLVNFSSLAADCGIDPKTARGWLSLLEASFVVYLLRPFHNNFHKRLIKSPKIYFYDTGLACSLLGISNPEQLESHYLRGGLFESFIISDLIKHQLHAGKSPECYFWRDVQGHEVDCLMVKDGKPIAIEIKSSMTITPSHFQGLSRFSKLAQIPSDQCALVYAGDISQKRSCGRLIGWYELPKLIE